MGTLLALPGIWQPRKFEWLALTNMLATWEINLSTSGLGAGLLVRQSLTALLLLVSLLVYVAMLLVHYPSSISASHLHNRHSVSWDPLSGAVV